MQVKTSRRIAGDDIKDLTIEATDVAADAITTSKVADGTLTGVKFETKTVERDKLTYLTQGGSLSVTSAGAYKAFPTAYTSAPQVVISPIEGSLDSFKIARVAVGSFQAVGSPTDKYFNWIAFGSA